ncbi:MAG: M23 family metallopeptidase [Sandaracinaceae bacterium]
MRGLALALLLVASPAAAQGGPLRPDPMQPSAWAPPAREDCYARAEGSDGTVARDHVCDGPRRVPIPDGEAAARAEALGLGGRPAADRLRIGRPRPEWLATLDAPPREDLLWPVARGLFSRGFGHVRRPEIRHRNHDGLDIVAEAGAHVRAANDGLVVYADNGVRGYGNLLILLHADGTATLYAHCQALYVGPGQLVRRGQVVGEVGATGLPYVPHLHFEWRRNGHPQDPLPHLVERPDAREVRPDEATRFAPPPPNVVAPVVTSGLPATLRRRGS